MTVLHFRILAFLVTKGTSPEPINAESLFNCIDTDDSSDFSLDEVCTEYKCKGESPIHTEEHINKYFAGTDCVTKCQLDNSLCGDDEIHNKQSCYDLD